MLLTPTIDSTLKEPIYMQLRRYVVEEIHSGRLVRDDQMPSVRKLATYLGISRNSVENAYNQLLAEGYIYSKERSGYYIADVHERTFQSSSRLSFTEDVEFNEEFSYDFKSEYISEDNFDFRLWKKHLNGVLNYESAKLYGYGYTRGEYPLRRAISDYFYRTRGVVANPNNIVIGGGVTTLLTMLVQLFKRIGIDAVGLEDPGFVKAKRVFDYSHMRTIPIPVHEDGIDINALKASDAKVCYVSPSHQYPTGSIIPIGKRQSLIQWADDNNGYIIEDDYNSELRFEGKPIPAMQGMDSGRKVIYLGSFSTVLAPAIRISFMVLPKVLNELYSDYEDTFSQSASKLEQLALSKLIDSGDFEKHIRKIRKNYSKKLDVLKKDIMTSMPKGMKARYGKSGLLIRLILPEGITAESVVEKCHEDGILVSAYRDFCINEKNYKEELILSYRGIDKEMMTEGIRRIGCIIDGLLKSRK